MPFCPNVVCVHLTSNLKTHRSNGVEVALLSKPFESMAQFEDYLWAGAFCYCSKNAAAANVAFMIYDTSTERTLRLQRKVHAERISALKNKHFA